MGETRNISSTKSSAKFPRETYKLATHQSNTSTTRLANMGDDGTVSAPSAPAPAPAPEPHRQMSGYEVRVIEETFKMFDVDENGTIDKKELTNVLGELNVTHDGETVCTMFRSIDTDGNNTVDMTEFKEAF